jgi:hypothetical protein
MSTNLQLCNLLIQKCGISGGALSTTANQRGESARVVQWIAEAWQNIQMSQPNWDWMRATCSFQTVAAQGVYTPLQCGINDFYNWKTDSFRRYVSSVGVRSENYLDVMGYDDYRDTYLFGNYSLTYGQPTQIAFAPDLTLNLGLIPDTTVYTIRGEYFRQPQVMVADGDTPNMPSQFHLLIVYAAMQMYAMYEAAAEVKQEADRLYRSMYSRLMRDQLSDATYASALA